VKVIDLQGDDHVTAWADIGADASARQGFSRRRFLRSASAGVAGSVVANAALADSLADVPPREPSAPINFRFGEDQITSPTLPQAELTTVASFPADFFLESLAVRRQFGTD
jgi:hypothetical protein